MTGSPASLRIGDHCSVIHLGTLYIYSEDGLQALPLKKGGKWTDLPMGVKVSGAQCVLTSGNDANNAAMYVVGGVAKSSPSYSGLQKYTFSTKKWQTVTPAVPVTANRLNHGAAYIPATDSILVYSGLQEAGASPLSSSTFLISAVDYGVQSFVSGGVPPVTAPSVITYNSTHALMVGGSADNTGVYVFGNGAWSDLGTTLPTSLKDRKVMKCSLVAGRDGSKVLETFDMSTVPNTVTQIALWTGSGPAKPGQLLGGTKSRKRKRDLTLASWPKYNSKNAPQLSRSQFSLASDTTSDLTVISGGSSKEPIVVFDQQKNSWVSTDSLFGTQQPLVINKHDSSSTSSSTSASRTSTSASSIVPPTSSTSTTSTSAPGLAPPDDDDNHGRTLAVLGATLGTIFGLAALLIIVLLLLRYKREKKKRVEGGYINEKEQDRLSFADQGTEFMHTAGGSVGHKYTASMNNSLTSLNIIAGKMDKKGGNKHQRNGGNMGSDSSTAGLVMKKSSPLGISDSVEMSRMRGSPGDGKGGITGLRKPPAAPTDPAPFASGRPGTSGSAKGGYGADADANSRSSGWSKYFSNDPTASGILGRKESISSSYTRASAVTHPSQNPQPLQLNLGPKFGEGALVDGRPISTVRSGSPVVGESGHSTHGQIPAHSQTAELARAASHKSTKSIAASSTWDEFNFETHGGTAATGAWTPMSEAPAWNPTPAASKSNHQNTMSVASSIYSRAPQSYYPGNDPSKNLYYKSGISTNAFPMPPKGAQPEENRDSSATVWPRPPEGSGLPPLPKTQYAAYNTGSASQKKAPVGDDVSWLNLG